MLAGPSPELGNFAGGFQVLRTSVGATMPMESEEEDDEDEDEAPRARAAPAFAEPPQKRSRLDEPSQQEQEEREEAIVPPQVDEGATAPEQEEDEEADELDEQPSAVAAAPLPEQEDQDEGGDAEEMHEAPSPVAAMPAPEQEDEDEEDEAEEMHEAPVAVAAAPAPEQVSPLPGRPGMAAVGSVGAGIGRPMQEVDIEDYEEEEEEEKEREEEEELVPEKARSVNVPEALVQAREHVRESAPSAPEAADLDMEEEEEEEPEEEALEEPRSPLPSAVRVPRPAHDLQSLSRCDEVPASTVVPFAPISCERSTAQSSTAPCLGSQVVASGTSPTEQPEVSDNWNVSKDICSLSVAGRIITLPRVVYDKLFGYQRVGVAWMWNLFYKRFGGLLADEMGLGKTVQVAAFLACLKLAQQASRFLIVVPVTLIEQWKRELKAWGAFQGQGLAVHVLHGTVHERHQAFRGLARDGGALIVSYDMLRNHMGCLRSASLHRAALMRKGKRKRKQKRGCRDDDSPSEEDFELPPVPPEEEGKDVPWDVVIVDEAHQIKNPSCVVGKDLRKLYSLSRFLLTGTPLQNNLTDLWALMDLAQPGLLGNHATFERDFSEQIARGSKKNASTFAVELKDNLARELKRLKEPHFLRRMKSEVAGPQQAVILGQQLQHAPKELPSKTDVVLWLNLTQAQLELYNLFLNSELVRRAKQGGQCGIEVLRAIAQLKNLCQHPLLCLPHDEFTAWRLRTVSSANRSAQQAAAAAVASSAVSRQSAGGAGCGLDGDDASQPAQECLHVLPRLRALVPNSVEGATLLSCKLRVLSVLLPQLKRRGHRCAIFSRSTDMLDLIQGCVLRVLDLKFLRIDGRIDRKDRDLKLAKFQQPGSKYFCMCLSSQVGGVGITITGANRVILVDPGWNPAMDAQAIDRVHRIGQDQEVVVYRLIGAGAIEDKMFRLQVFKRGLAKTALEHEQQLRYFSHKELKQIFEVPSQSASTQSLMAEQLGTEALEHEELLRVVANDVGGTDDPAALPFWQSSDVLGFSDYEKLFMYLEQVQNSDGGASEDVEEKARQIAQKLSNEEYIPDQVVEGKFKAAWRDTNQQVAPPQQVSEFAPLQDG
eukprot:TRINITY_DN5999_c0_g1_i2.p1 TRINITY_DN5999_c0_g1~~TRINITY_DN5999_c0_g1_i2.p1  ORF type:complete len:1235 (+),score=293.63 TRINITY_DN5999_c0_g1_i2:388-3705(+)